MRGARLACGVVAMVALLACGAAHAEVSFEQFKSRFRESDVMLLDRAGQPLGSIRIDASVRRLEWVTLDEVSPAMIEALLVAEDRRFYEHAGVDWTAVAGAVWQRLGGGASARGASTLSMQVAAMLDPSLARPGGPRTVAQKWSQIDAARALERGWSKAQIVEAYLNTVSFRGELQGLRAASRALFDKGPSGLDRRESAVLAALIRAPGAEPAVVARRACGILLQTRGAASDCGAQAIATHLRQSRLAPQVAEPLAPHAARRLLAAGDSVRSSLDASIQRAARAAVAAQIAQLSERGVEDGAAVVLDNRSGQVLAYIGSSGIYSRAAQVDAADAPRQAGSTLKPFLYGLAFARHQLSAATLLDDSPVALATDAGLYTPQNYNRQFLGAVSVRRALASSLNVPAVRALAITGVAPLHKLLRELGLTTLNDVPEHYGSSLALGAADVSLLELTNAYRALANGGEFSVPRWRADDEPAPRRRVLDAGAAWLVGDILADNAARFGTFGFDSVLATPVWTAVKTGTSKDMRDNWCVGYSEHYTVGVWVGNAGGAPMRDVSGVSGAAPAWAEIMAALHATLGSRPPKPPAGVARRDVAFAPAIEPTRSEWFLAGTLPPTDHPGALALHTVHLAKAAGMARITQPAPGTLVAWDPDIPPAVQGIVARYSGSERDLQWRLNGAPLAVGPRVVLPLVPGRNALALMSSSGEVIDEVGFEVRGMPRTDSAPVAP